MTDLAGRGALGPKPPKAGPKPRKAIPRRSKKRAAYMASDDRQRGLEHMGLVKCLPCIICGKPGPSEAHHVEGDKMPRDDLRTIPLCPPCHTGPDGYHKAKRSWVAANGPDYELLPAVQIMLYGGTIAE